MTAEQRAEHERLATMPDEAIDLSDMPEVRDWSRAQRGRFPRAPAGEAVTVRLDSETLAWFRAHASDPAAVEADIAVALQRHVQAAKTPA